MTSPPAGRDQPRPGAGKGQDAFLQALALHRQGKIAEAETAYRAILKSQHRHFDAAHFLGLIFLNRGEAEAAERQIGRALKFAPSGANNLNVAEAHNNHGLALTGLGRYDDALASFDAALTIAPRHVSALSNRGGALQKLDRCEEAVAACDTVLALQPGFATAHHIRGKTLYRLGRFEEALAAFDRAVALQPDFHDAHYDRGLTRILLGRFAEGWPDTEHRWRAAEFGGAGQLDFPATPQALRDRPVRVAAEQGIGDEIMFASMIPDLLRDAGSVTVECDPRLRGLFARSFPGAAIADRFADRGQTAAEVLIAAQSLGRLYRNRLEDFPHRGGYLRPDPAAAAAWTSRLSGLEGLRIGLSWKGGTDRTHRQSRSIPLERWSALLGLPGTSFVSLQYGEVKDQIDAANRGLARPITCFPAREIDDFDALAALVSSLDLVITVQTALVHLAGAIGKDCRVLVPHVPEWRYGAGGARMPWYDSVTLYRQDAPGAWEPVLDRIAAAVRTMTSDAG